MGLLRSLAFGGLVLVAAILLLLSNLGLWALSSVQDGTAFDRIGSVVLERTEVRSLVARRLAERMAPILVSLGPLDGDIRRALGVPARPTVPEAETAVRHHLEGYLGDPATIVALDAALSDVRTELLARRSGPTADASLDIDLRPVLATYLDRLDPSGALTARIPDGLARLPLVGAPTMRAIAPVLDIVVALRWLLPLACAVVLVGVLLLARHRVHAVAWVGLVGVTVGTGSLLLASALPLVLPRLLDVDAAASLAATGTLQVVMAGLVVQSAVIAVAGLAMVVAGIAASAVTSDRVS